MEQNIKNNINESISIIQMIGKGSQGIVYKGSFQDGTQIAVKYQRQISDREIYILKQIQIKQHPHIIQIFQISYLKGLRQPCYEIMMPLGEQNLYEFIQTSEFKQFDQIQKDKLFLQAIQGVKSLHLELNYFHRDIKAENFVVSRENSEIKLRLIDFGSSKEVPQNISKNTLNVGSPCYMAPELVKELNYGSKIDIWSLGVLYYEFNALKDLFDGKTVDEVKTKIRQVKQFEIDQIIKNDIQEKTAQYHLKLMLKVDPEERIDIEGLNNNFIKTLGQLQDLNDSQNDYQRQDEIKKSGQNDFQCSQKQVSQSKANKFGNKNILDKSSSSQNEEQKERESKSTAPTRCGSNDRQNLISEEFHNDQVSILTEDIVYCKERICNLNLQINSNCEEISMKTQNSQHQKSSQTKGNLPPDQKKKLDQVKDLKIKRYKYYRASY